MLLMLTAFLTGTATGLLLNPVLGSCVSDTRRSFNRVRTCNSGIDLQPLGVPMPSWTRQASHPNVAIRMSLLFLLLLWALVVSTKMLLQSSRHAHTIVVYSAPRGADRVDVVGTSLCSSFLKIAASPWSRLAVLMVIDVAKGRFAMRIVPRRTGITHGDHVLGCGPVHTCRRNVGWEFPRRCQTIPVLLGMLPAVRLVHRCQRSRL